MITARDLQTLSDATLELYAPDLHGGNWVDHALRFLSAVVASDMVNYGDLDIARGTLAAATTCERSYWLEAVAGFGACMQKYRYFCFDPEVNEGRPFFRSDFVSARQFRDLDIYSECFAILETRDHAAVHVPSDDGHLRWFGVERGGRADFDERERLLLELAQQHLLNAFRLAEARARVRSEFVLDATSFRRAGFSAREAEVAYWLTEGKSNGEIALLLRLHVQTIKGLIASLFDRTGTGNRLALTLHLLELSRTVLRGQAQLQLVPARGFGSRVGTRGPSKEREAS